MPGRWFRIAFARNAFLRLLAERGQRLDELTVAEGIRAMVDFSHDHRPQHAHLDELEARWGPNEDRFEFAVVRRMQRHGQPEAALSLRFGFTLTPGRQGHGSATIESLREATSTPGYRAIARAAITGRDLR